ncbi:hypothetical protein JCM9279_004274 [Rhodotorula babjevae]
MDAGLPILSSKTLPVAYALHQTSLCPADLDLAALPSPLDAADSRLALYRTGAAPDRVWDWVPPPPPAPPPTGKLGGLGLLKGKGKAQPVGKVARVAWNPQGDTLAVLVSPPASSSSSPSTLSLLSIHTGAPLVPAAAPLPSTSTPTTLTWQRLALAHDPLLPSWGIALVDRLPALPKIPKDGLAAAGAADGPGGAPRMAFGAGGAGGPGAGGGGAAGGGGGGGVFGAKQAMLERERAKEAQRPLSMQDAVERFPTLLPAARPEDEAASGEGGGDPKVRAMVRPRLEGGEADAVEHTVLCVGDEKGGCHMFLGGSVYLGSVDVGGPVIAITSLPSSSPVPCASFAVHLSTSASPLAVRVLALPLPPTLSTILRQSSALRALLQHAFDALQDTRNLWDEARRIGKGWLQRIADVSRPHGVTTPPTTQLHLLLLTGRPTRALHDFLASKMNERGLVKWEQAMGLALERARRVGWVSVAPAMERVVVLLREVDAWARWPEKFDTYTFERDEVLRATELAKEAVRASAFFQREVEEEERCFKQFSVWLHYELDKVAQQEGSEIRPLAAFDPLPVSHYIQHRLPSTAATLAPFLAFGLASAPLKDCAELKAAEAWVAQLPVGARALRDAELGLIDGESTVGGMGEGAGNDARRLDALVRRMTEEVQGQVDADELASRTGTGWRRTGSSLVPGAFNPAPAAKPEEVPSWAEGAGADPDNAPRPPPGSASPSSSPFGSKAAPSSSKTPRAPQSLPALLHLTARLVGGVFDRGVRAATGAHAHLGEPVERDAGTGMVDEGAEAGELRLRTRVAEDGRLEEVWARGSTITVSRQLVALVLGNLSAVETASYDLRVADGPPFRVVELDFAADDELVLGVAVLKDGAPPRYLLAHAKLADLEWSPESRSPTSPLPLASHVPLDPAYPPSALAFRTTPSGRQLVASLSGEGRRLEVLDAAGVDAVPAQEMEM